MKCKWKESCGYDICMEEYCSEFEGVPLTNGDRIRAMTDDEMANNPIIREAICNHIYDSGKSKEFCLPNMGCRHCVVKWLKQPAKEDA